MPASAKINTEILFDASAAMADPERWRIAQTVFGDQATYATRREQLALRKVGGGCDVPHDPLVPLGADQADRLVQAVKGSDAGRRRRARRFDQDGGRRSAR